MVTIAGCIQNAPPSASASATAGGANAPSAGASASVGTSGQQRFVLSNAKPSASTSASAVGTTGTSTRYELDGQSAELTKHLNHQVEITGTVQSSSASSTGAGAAAPGSAAATPKLMVSSVKMVSATCDK